MSPDKRKDGESYETYKARLRRQKAIEKAQDKGTLVWDSTLQGTFRKPKKR